MPIKIPHELPAFNILNNENIFVMSKDRAEHQDIRPLKIIILNIMPKKIETETQLLRLLSNTPIQVDIELLHLVSHVSKNTPSNHLSNFYTTFDQIKNNKYDGMIITGAPVEQLEFEEVDYWEEICEIMDWSKKNVFSTLHICWGAQAGLYHHFGIKKHLLPQKLFGVFPHTRDFPHSQIIKGFDDIFMVPHSRHTTIERADVEKISCLQIVTSSEQAGVHIVANKNGRQYFITGHSEYDRNTLADEYFRDKEKGLDIQIPYNYFPNDDPSQRPVCSWKSHANLLFSNWLNYCIYQCTPYDLSELDVRNWNWEAGFLMNEANDFSNPYYQNTSNEPGEKPASALAVTALVLGIISIFTSFFMVNIVIGIIAIILAAVSLAKKQSGKGISITAILLSVLSIAFTALVIYLIYPLLAVVPDLYNDMKEIYKDYDAIIEEYDRTGELPDYMDKYSEGEVGEFFDEYYGGFDNFFDNNLRLEN